MSPRPVRLALLFALLALPAVAGPPREDRRAARIRPSSVRSENPEVQPSEAIPIAATAADASGVDLAGLLGMLTALAATYVYARSQRLSPLTRGSAPPPSVTLPPDRR
jgi:hypothetical protein